MKKHTLPFIIGVLFLLVVSSLQCDQSSSAKLPYVPDSNEPIHSKTFPLLWRTRMPEGDQIIIRGSWMRADRKLRPSGRTIFIDSPPVEGSPAHHNFTVTSQTTNCSKTYDLTFSMPIASTTTLPSSLSFQQSFITYGGPMYDIDATFEQTGMVKLDVFVKDCPSFSKVFPLPDKGEGYDWKNFLERINFFDAEVEGQSWNYQSFPSKCDASLAKIVVADSFFQSEVVRAKPQDPDGHIHTPSFTATLLVDDYSCSGARTAYSDKVAAFASQLGGILCKELNLSSDQECNIGSLKQPFSGCPPVQAQEAVPKPSSVMISNESSSKHDNSRAAAAIILIVLLSGVLLLVLSVLGVWISKKVEAQRRKTPPAAIEMFIQSEDRIFTVADDPFDSIENI